MKKKLMVFLILFIVLGVGGYLGYKTVMHKVAAQVVDQVATHLSNQDINRLKKDPDVRAVLSHSKDSDGTGDSADDTDLPIHTKDQAIKMVMKKFSAGEVKDMAAMAINGLDEKEKAEIKNKIESRLSPEEIKALKAIAIKQLQK